MDPGAGQWPDPSQARRWPGLPKFKNPINKGIATQAKPSQILYIFLLVWLRYILSQYPSQAKPIPYIGFGVAWVVLKRYVICGVIARAFACDL